MGKSRGTLATLARGPRSQANLRHDFGGNKKPSLTPAEKAELREARLITRGLLTSKTYLKKLRERLNTGRCQPGVEVALWQYAFGKPVETIETKPPVPVRITHEYSE